MVRNDQVVETPIDRRSIRTKSFMGSETNRTPDPDGICARNDGGATANLKDHDRLLRQMLGLEDSVKFFHTDWQKSYLGCRDSVGKKAFQPMEQLLLGSRVQHSQITKTCKRPFEAGGDSFDLDRRLPAVGLPELGVRRWHDTTVSTPVTMQKHRGRKSPSSSPEDQVRLPGQASIMQPISITHRMHDGSDNHLGLRVFRPNPDTVERSLRFGMNIHEGMTMERTRTKSSGKK